MSNLGSRVGLKGKIKSQSRSRLIHLNKESGQTEGHSKVEIQVANRPKPEEGVQKQTLTKTESETH